jgi:hypothetical protein
MAMSNRDHLPDHRTYHHCAVCSRYHTGGVFVSIVLLMLLLLLLCVCVCVLHICLVCTVRQLMRALFEWIVAD